jgi:hypothetical protein
LRRAFKDDFFSDQKKQAHEDYLASLPKPRKPSKPRKPTLVSVSKDARKAGIDPARIEIKPDGSYVVDIGKPEPVAPENPWPLDEFRTKETKQ